MHTRRCLERTSERIKPLRYCQASGLVIPAGIPAGLLQEACRNACGDYKATGSLRACGDYKTTDLLQEGLLGWITRLQEPCRRPAGMDYEATGALQEAAGCRSPAAGVDYEATGALQEACRSPAGMDYEAAGVLQGWMTTLQHLFAQNFFSILH